MMRIGNQVKKLVLFGSGIFTNRFLDEFDGCYEVYSVIDNNSARWGTTIKECLLTHQIY